MKHALVAVLALAMATPVISIPTVSDAQVLTRRSGAAPARRPRAQPPRLTTEEQDSLYAAQDLIADLNAELADLQRLGTEQGGLTEEQRALVEAHTTRRAEAQATIDRLIAKRGY
jgi:hypothetical protein